MKPGVNWLGIAKACNILIAQSLLKNNFIKGNLNDIMNNKIYYYFMPHRLAHFIGLDVHDVGLWHEPIEKGMAFTVEPGIYIREESLGIRIENDFIITDDAPFDLMQNIPIEAEEIEDLMNS